MPVRILPQSGSGAREPKPLKPAPDAAADDPPAQGLDRRRLAPPTIVYTNGRNLVIRHVGMVELFNALMLAGVGRFGEDGVPILDKRKFLRAVRTGELLRWCAVEMRDLKPEAYGWGPESLRSPEARRKLARLLGVNAVSRKDELNDDYLSGILQKLMEQPIPQDARRSSSHKRKSKKAKGHRRPTWKWEET